MKTLKGIIAGIIGFLLLIWITGLYKYIPKTKLDVMQKVKLTVTGEEYELISSESLFKEGPRTVEYLFRSKDRDLEFYAYSTYQERRSGWILCIPPDKRLESVVYVRYYEAIKNYYKNDVLKLIEDSPYYHEDNEEKDWNDWYGSPDFTFYVENYDQLQEVISTVSAVSKLYEEEKKYHGREWMIDHPLCKFDVYYRYENEEGESKLTLIHETEINGLVDENTIAARINNEYKKNIDN